jgi:hypothetical protein
VGAKLVNGFDPKGREGRTWESAGPVEDVVTESAADPAAPLSGCASRRAGEALTIKQVRLSRKAKQDRGAPRLAS